MPPKKPNKPQKNNKNKKNYYDDLGDDTDDDTDIDIDKDKNNKKNNKDKDKDKDKDKNKNKDKDKDKNDSRRRQRDENDTKDKNSNILSTPPTSMELLFFWPKNEQPPKKLETLDDLILNMKKSKEKKYVCTNKLCDHSDLQTSKNIKVPQITYISNLSQLIELGKSFHCKKNRQCGNINLRVLHELIEPLEELQRMIGLNNVKDKIVDQLLYFLQGYHNNEQKCNNCIDCEYGITCMKNQSDMLHTCISGPPGVGKTELGRCLGKIYRKLGILSNDKFKIFTRSDLVGEFLGQTAVKTQKCINECQGGVMFIDEAYALGNEEKRDSFSKECIDTINQNLSEKRDFLCIIAGYKDSLENCFFKYNEGLNRRFTFRYDIEPYKWNELKKIFELKVLNGGFATYYDVENDNDTENIKIQELFKKNEQKFPNSGGDIETLFLKSKIIHSRNILNNQNEKYILSYNDIKNGMDALVSARNALKKDESHLFGMYI